MIIIIKPISKRAKNRVREHGNQFQLVERVKHLPLFDSPAMFLKTMDNKWFGWFADNEIEIL
jgi:hypothetical protein